jgi:hypothetical protein
MGTRTPSGRAPRLSLETRARNTSSDAPVKPKTTSIVDVVEDLIVFPVSAITAARAEAQWRRPGRAGWSSLATASQKNTPSRHREIRSRRRGTL